MNFKILKIPLKTMYKNKLSKQSMNLFRIKIINLYNKIVIFKYIIIRVHPLSKNIFSIQF